MRKTILAIISILILLTWCSCSKKYHLKRSKHHYQKAIAKGYKPLIDTTYVYDTIRLTGVTHDTIFKNSNDTIRIKKDRLKVIYKYDTLTNQVYLSGECSADTIIKEIPITTQETVYIEKEFWDVFKWWQWLLIALGFLFIVILSRIKII